jgi:trans-aconitate methyltransferase
MNKTQKWDPSQYARNARFVSELGQPVVDLLAPQPGERILDLGCGDGALTVHFRELGCDVVAVDASPEQVAATQALGIEASVVDARALPFDREFDAVFSNAVLHWVHPPESAIDGVWRALKSGGRFVAEMGGDRCVEKIRRALIGALNRRGIDGSARDPWYFPTPEAYGALLRARGFVVTRIELIPRPTPLPGPLVPWLETFGQSFTAALTESERPAYLEEVQEVLRPELCDAEGLWTADYTRLRFAAVKP